MCVCVPRTSQGGRRSTYWECGSVGPQIEGGLGVVFLLASRSPITGFRMVEKNDIYVGDLRGSWFLVIFHGFWAPKSSKNWFSGFARQVHPGSNSQSPHLSAHFGASKPNFRHSHEKSFYELQKALETLIWSCLMAVWHVKRPRKSPGGPGTTYWEVQASKSVVFPA